MSDRILSDLSRKLRLLLNAGVFFSAAVVSAYIFNFGPAAGFKFSHAGGDWSNLGDYIGGLLGPLFSFLAFVGVLHTLELQAKQLKDASAQAQLEEFQRLVASVSAIADGILDEEATEVVPDMQEGKRSKATITLARAIQAAGTAGLQLERGAGNANFNELIDTIKGGTRSQLDMLKIELHQLTWVLIEYRKMGGSPVVIDFYRQRYAPYVCWLHAMKETLSAQIVEFFDPQNLREALQPD